MPVTAATREVLQSAFRRGEVAEEPQEYLQKDFAALAETMALAAGMKLERRTRKCRPAWSIVSAHLSRCRPDAASHEIQERPMCSRPFMAARPGLRRADMRNAA